MISAPSASLTHTHTVAPRWTLVYGVMGQEQSDASDSAPGDVQNLSGYRVMRVFRGSPAARSGLSAFGDFIIAFDGTLVDVASPLADALRAREGKPVSLSVWSCVDSAERMVELTPSAWNGPGLLGAAVRFEPVRGAIDSVWRVLDVMPGSPADIAGLVPRSDFVVGTPAEVFRKESDLSTLTQDAANNDMAATVMVYSTATGRVRNVEILPNRDWGGDGLLGCELATGLLHRLSREGPAN
jgi:hypothetical protein